MLMVLTFKHRQHCRVLKIEERCLMVAWNLTSSTGPGSQGLVTVYRNPSSSLLGLGNLAIGIGIQNFPEGLAVSLPLQAAGFSTLKSFWYGQLSGMVEPIAGVLGAACVSLASPVLPYALAFAAGAMIYVVVDDIIPEAHQSGNGTLASWGAMVGFLIMMSLDVGLG
ncbi:hypothetical protein KQX54_006326 [Cotesia glomerata]|uniref:Zinc transporter ZIP11 n=1 Tax=Cotesia glomerata TaxID=32391 RepID=A0AAV7I7G0_COTGL|nr:hypothetical protein KQX54_006326 [Cotesia glomerata]